MNDGDDPAHETDEELPDETVEQQAPQQDSASSAGALRKRQTRSRSEQKQAEKFWKGVLADPVGRREMWRILQDGHCFDTRFACGPNGFPQTEATWFQAGEQAFVLGLYQKWMLVDRAGVFLMHDEHDARFSRAGRPPRQRSE